jgi:hypothetical protein
MIRIFRPHSQLDLSLTKALFNSSLNLIAVKSISFYYSFSCFEPIDMATIILDAITE